MIDTREDGEKDGDSEQADDKIRAVQPEPHRLQADEGELLVAYRVRNAAFSAAMVLPNRSRQWRQVVPPQIGFRRRAKEWGCEVVLGRNRKAPCPYTDEDDFGEDDFGDDEFDGTEDTFEGLFNPDLRPT